jgi:hypothetical protein
MEMGFALQASYKEIYLVWDFSGILHLKNVQTSFYFLFFILSFLHLFTYIYIVWATPSPHPFPGRTCSALLFSDFVEEKI